MRFVPINYLKGNEILAVNITNSNMQTLVRDGTILTQKIISRIKNYGVKSLYIIDEKTEKFCSEIITDTIQPILRDSSVNKIKLTFERFEKRISKQKTKLKYGDSGAELLQEVKSITSDLIYEILNSKNTQVAMNDIKTNSDYYYKHSVNVAVLSIIIGTELGLSSTELENLTYGALLLDVGCKLIDDTLLLKEDILTKDEFKIVKEHVNYSYNHINNNTTFNAHVKSIIMHHHERMNGTGYPNGLKSSEIHPLAKIVMIADVYDSLTSDRPFRFAYKQHEAIEYMMSQAGELFDFKIINIFARKIIPYPVGTYVLLSNKQQGIIIKNNIDHPLRPIVRTFGKSSYTNTNDVHLDLLKTNNVIINKIIYEITR